MSTTEAMKYQPMILKDSVYRHFYLEESILLSPGSCNMYDDDNNSTCEFLSNVMTSRHCADELRGIRIRNWNELITVSQGQEQKIFRASEIS